MATFVRDLIPVCILDNPGNPCVLKKQNGGCQKCLQSKQAMDAQAKKNEQEVKDRLAVASRSWQE